MGLVFGVLNGLFTPSAAAMAVLPVGCGVLAGLWKAMRGLTPDELATRNEMIRDGTGAFTLAHVPFLEAGWQCLLAYVATGVTVAIRWFFG